MEILPRSDVVFCRALWGGWLLNKISPGVEIRNPVLGFVGGLFAVFAIIFLGATLSFLVADAGGSVTVPPPPRWTRFVGLFYFVLIFGLGALGEAIFGSGVGEHWMRSPLVESFRMLSIPLLAASIPLTSFACAAAGRPTAIYWDKIGMWINGLWLGLVFFAACAIS